VREVTEDECAPSCPCRTPPEPVTDPYVRPPPLVTLRQGLGAIAWGLLLGGVAGYLVISCF
jgi:hypothetical protein